MKKESDESTSSILICGEITASAKEISNYFKDFFTSVSEKINKNIAKSKKTHLSCYLAMKTRTQFSFLQLYHRTLKT